MPRNIVVFSDGTGQDGGVRPDQRLSNVYKLYRATRIGPDSPIDPAEQIAFYDPGLGTDDDVHGWEKISRRIDKLLGSVAGRGIGTNIADCYEFLINHWSPGDRIFIIGFSRGAYTARCVAQVLALCGVPIHESDAPEIPFRRFTRNARKVAERAVHQVYEHGAGHPRGTYEGERETLGLRFRTEFGSDEGGVPNACPHFIGVFDTVAALGAKKVKWLGILAILSLAGAALAGLMVGIASYFVGFRFWPAFALVYAAGWLLVWAKSFWGSVRYIDHYPNPNSPRRWRRVYWRADNYDRGLSGHVGYARQASAIDEDRADFPRVPWGRNTVIRDQQPGEPPPVVQLWFAGNHSDVGGSYAEEESRLSDIALEWMVEEATSIPHPLIVDVARLKTSPDALGAQHSEVERVKDWSLWWVPNWAPAALRNGWPLEHRKPEGSPVHPSVFERFAAGAVVQSDGTAPYRPINLQGDDRFAAFYSDSASADPMDLASATYTADDGAFEGKLQALAPDFARILNEAKAETAAIVMLPPNPIEAHDAYRDALALRYLDQLVARGGWSSVPLRCSDGKEQPDTRSGRLVLGLDEAAALSLARSVGQVTTILVGPNGTSTALPSIRGKPDAAGA
jgi:hypothetical protein